MRLKLWNAVLFAALIVALGMFTHPRACQAGYNDDVELVQPPSDNGDPDSGGQSRFWTQGWALWIRNRVQSFAQVRLFRETRPAISARTSQRRSSLVRR
jgi:hypothetical protein